MRSLLKFITCGSVDDGKSTLIGHILYDAKLLYADQARALELESKAGSRGGKIDYSLLLDGLMAEREQGITIDVAYRYFTTSRRSFIVADTPGHEEYTRNMAVGASFADLAVILIDATQGVLVQTRRHVRICALMGIRYFVFAVNKMDLAGYDQSRFARIEEQIHTLAKALRLKHIKIIPVSATEGDNVTQSSGKMPWYTDGPLLDYLEEVDVSAQGVEEGFYMPVQRVCRPDHTFRGYEGQVEAGTVQVGDTLTALPSGEAAKVKRLLVGMADCSAVSMGRPLTIQLDREVDVSRGCVFSKDTTLPLSSQITATLLWMDDEELVVGKEYLLKLGTKQIPAVLTGIQYKTDVNTGNHLPASHLVKNEIALCDLLLQEPVVADSFQRHKTLGELILVDRVTNMTSACGVVEETTQGKMSYSFVHGDVRARSDLFEEFYYNLNSANIAKVQTPKTIYTVGDPIPTRGESYHYPEDFDILALHDQAVVEIRGGKVAAIERLPQYHYTGFPLVNSSGFSIKVHSKETYQAFLDAFRKTGENANAGLFDKWMAFETYRSIKFHDNFWII